MTEEPEPTEDVRPMRRAVRYFYDLQRLRIQSGGRSRSAGTELEGDDAAFIKKMSGGLEDLEKEALREVKRLLKTERIWTDYLANVKGVGPTMAGVIISEIDITRCNTVSALWRFAGMGVDPKTSQAEKRTKGEKSHYNGFLKTKMVGVLADVFIKVKSPWADVYYNYKNRLQSKNWGKSDGHRHRAALRYMMKMFLLDLWKVWRTMEGLPTPDTYNEVYLGKGHGDHGVARAQA